MSVGVESDHPSHEHHNCSHHHHHAGEENMRRRRRVSTTAVRRVKGNDGRVLRHRQRDQQRLMWLLVATVLLGLTYYYYGGKGDRTGLRLWHMFSRLRHAGQQWVSGTKPKKPLMVDHVGSRFAMGGTNRGMREHGPGRLVRGGGGVGAGGGGGHRRPLGTGGVGRGFGASEIEAFMSQQHGLEREWILLDETTSIDDPAWQDILHARIHLVDLLFFPGERQIYDYLPHFNLHQHHDSVDGQDQDSSRNYAGLYGVFCRLDWKVHKTDPSSVPMFRDLVDNSTDCDEKRVKVPYRLLIDRVREFDQTTPTAIKFLDFAGAVFHESRCGSTLVANLLATMDPPSHRVYSESGPPITVMMLAPGGMSGGSISQTTAGHLLRDTVYLMQRSNDFAEQRVFFKMQSAGSLQLPLFRTAFPDTPWLFVYRDPVQVMVSHLMQAPHHNMHMANCVRMQKKHAPQAVVDIIERHFHHRNVTEISPVDYCAAHLASITETAVSVFQKQQQQPSNRFGMAVNYRDLPAALWQDVLPHHFHLVVSDEARERMVACASQYSKGRTSGSILNPSLQQKRGEFHEDSAAKEAAASPSLKQAAARILQPSFDYLEHMSSAGAAGVVASL